MKKGIVFSIAMAGIGFFCQAQDNVNSEVKTYSEQPTYQLDRQLSKQQTGTTDNHGAMGAGSGSSYAGYSYRSSAYKNVKKEDVSVSPVVTSRK